MLLEIFIIQKKVSTCLLRRSFIKQKELEVNASLFSGLISAISMFMSETKIGDIQHFETGEHRVLISPYKDIFVVGIVEHEREDDFVNTSIMRISEAFFKRYSDVIQDDVPELSQFQEFSTELDNIVYSEFEKTYISKNFPKNMIRVVREFQSKFEDQILSYIGFKSGKRRGTNSKSMKDFIKKLSKEMNLFSVSKITDQSVNSSNNKILVSIPMCPLCRQIKDKDFACSFFIGFIEGFSRISYPDKDISVEETSCIAHGEKSCEFLLDIIDYNL